MIDMTKGPFTLNQPQKGGNVLWIMSNAGGVMAEVRAGSEEVAREKANLLMKALECLEAAKALYKAYEDEGDEGEEAVANLPMRMNEALADVMRYGSPV